MSLIPDDDTLLAILAICLKKQESENKVKKKKKIWMKERHRIRKKFTHHDLQNELKEAPFHDFRYFLTMNNGALYEELLEMLTPLIHKKDTVMREAIPTSQRFATALRFLATGRDFEGIKDSSEISSYAVSKIVFETCEAISVCLKDYMKLPQSPAQWQPISEAFDTKWNVPNCLGAVHAAHIAIKKPPGSGSLYYNHKKFFSIVLTAVVNANYEFMAAEIGTNGRTSDGQTFALTSLGKAIQEKSLNIPAPRILPMGNQILPHFFVGTDAFQTTEDLLTPFNETELTYDEQIFNYRLKRANQVAENALGVLCARFGVFQHPMRLAPERAQIIVQACCHLYNFLSRKTDNLFVMELADYSDLQTGMMISGPWRDLTKVTPLQDNTLATESNEVADHVKDMFMNYFNNEGQVAWQEQEIDIN